tara:strand:- start:678 stop:1529 length:852 start_codon:yes stop_codon:yes gene_type:complete
MSKLVKLEYIYVPDPAQDRALFNAKLYFGLVGTDPSNVTNQVPVYSLQEDGSEIRIPQPVATNSGGVPTYNGSPTRLTVDDDYSFAVHDRLDVEVYLSLTSTDDSASEAVISESITLTDGQVIVNLTTISTAGAVFYIAGDFVDRGRLYNPSDYTITSDTSITLTNSFPNGSVITGLQSNAQSSIIPNPVDFFTIKEVTSPYALLDSDSQSLLTFNDAGTGIVNIADGLTIGHSVLANNIGGGAVQWVMLGTETIRGADTLAAVTSQMTIAKITPTVWQSSER